MFAYLSAWRVRVLPPPTPALARPQAAALGIALALASLHGLALQPLHLLGYVGICLAIVLALLLCIVSLTRRPSFPKPLLPVLLLIACIVTLYTAAAFRSPNERSLVVTAIVTAVLLFFASMAMLTWRPTALRTLLLFTFGIVAVNFLFAVQWHSGLMTELGIRSRHDMLAPTQPMTIGSLVYPLLFFQLLGFVPAISKWYTRVLGAVGTVMILGIVALIRARSVWVASVVAFGAYALWPVLARRRWAFTVFFAAVLVGAMTVAPAYISIQDRLDVRQLMDGVEYLSGERLFSGRNLFWPLLLDAIRRQPVFGYGSGVSMQQLTGFALSAHSLYIQTAIQAGLPALAALCALLLAGWTALWRGRSSPVVRLAGAFTTGMVVSEALQITLTQNAVGIGLFHWLILAVGISFSMREGMPSQSTAPPTPRACRLGPRGRTSVRRTT